MSSKLIRSKDIIWEELDGQALLIHARSGARWILNAAAANIWKQCDGYSSIGDLARHDVAEYCGALIAQGLLQACPVESAARLDGVAMATPLHSTPAFRSIGTAGLGSTPRRRASPRGNSGPG